MNEYYHHATNNKRGANRRRSSNTGPRFSLEGVTPLDFNSADERERLQADGVTPLDFSSDADTETHYDTQVQVKYPDGRSLRIPTAPRAPRVEHRTSVSSDKKFRTTILSDYDVFVESPGNRILDVQKQRSVTPNVPLSEDCSSRPSSSGFSRGGDAEEASCSCDMEEKLQNLCSCDEDEDGENSYEKMGADLADYLQEQMTSDQSGGGDISSGAEFEFYQSGSGTTCDNLLSQTMGQPSMLDQLPQDSLNAEVPLATVQVSTPTIQKNQMMSEPEVLKPPDEETPLLTPNTETALSLSGASTPMQSLRTAAGSEMTKGPEDFYTAELGLDSTSSEFEDAPEDLSLGGSRGGLGPHDTANEIALSPEPFINENRVKQMSPVSACEQFAKKTDIFQESGFDQCSMREPPTSHGSEEIGEGRADGTDELMGPSQGKGSMPSQISITQVDENEVSGINSSSDESRTSSSRQTYTMSQEITVISRKNSDQLPSVDTKDFVNTPAGSTAYGNLPNLNSQEGATPSLHSQTGATPSLHSQTGATPSLHSQTGASPSLLSQTGASPSLHSQTGASPSLHSQTGATPILYSQTGATPSLHSQTGATPSDSRIRTPFGSPSMASGYGSLHKTPTASHIQSSMGETPYQSMGETPYQSMGETPYQSMGETPYQPMHPLGEMRRHSSGAMGRSNSESDLFDTEGKDELLASPSGSAALVKTPASRVGDSVASSYQSLGSIIRSNMGPSTFDDSRDDETINSDDNGDFTAVLNEEDTGVMPCADQAMVQGQDGDDTSFVSTVNHSDDLGADAVSDSSGYSVDYEDYPEDGAEKGDKYNVKVQRLIQYDDPEGLESRDRVSSTYQVTEKSVTSLPDGTQEIEHVISPYEQVFHGPIQELEEIWTLAEVENEQDSSSSLAIHANEEDASQPYVTATGQQFFPGSSENSLPVVKSMSFSVSKDTSGMGTSSLEYSELPEKLDEGGAPSQPIELATTPPKMPPSNIDNSPHLISYDSPFATEEEGGFSRSPRKSSATGAPKQPNAIVEAEELKSEEDILTEVVMRTSVTRETVIEKEREDKEEEEEIDGEKGNQDAAHSTPRHSQTHSSLDFQKALPFIFMSLEDMQTWPELLTAKRKMKTTKHLKTLERITFHEDFKIDSCYLGDAHLRNFVLGFIGHKSLKQALLSRGAGDISSIVAYVEEDTLNKQLVDILRRAQLLAKNFNQHVRDYERTIQRLSSSDIVDSKSFSSFSRQDSRKKMASMQSSHKKTPRKMTPRSFTPRKFTPRSQTRSKASELLKSPKKRSSYSIKNHFRSPYNKGSTYMQRAMKRHISDSTGHVPGAKTSKSQADSRPYGIYSRKPSSKLSTHAETSLDLETPIGVSLDMASNPDAEVAENYPVFLKLKRDEAVQNVQSIQYIQKNYGRKSFQRNFMSPRCYISEKMPESANLNAVSNSFSNSPRRENAETNDAALKFEAFKYFIRALFSRLYGPNSNSTQKKFRHLWKLNSPAGFTSSIGSLPQDKENTKAIIEELLQIQLHDDIYDVFWESLGLEHGGSLDLTSYMERARDWGMILAEDDQYRHFVSALMKNLQNHRFYRNDQAFSNDEITLDEAAEFLSELTGVVVSPAQVGQLLNSVNYNCNSFTRADIMESISNTFESAWKSNSRQNMYGNRPSVVFG